MHSTCSSTGRVAFGSIPNCERNQFSAQSGTVDFREPQQKLIAVIERNTAHLKQLIRGNDNMRRAVEHALEAAAPISARKKIDTLTDELILCAWKNDRNFRAEIEHRFKKKN